MSDQLASQLAKLSPEKRALLFEKLQKEKKKEGSSKPSREITVQARDKDHYPLSFAQQRLWFLQQYEPENPEYNVPQGYRLFGPLQSDLMMQALDLLLARHESLRTIFFEVDEQPVQVIQPLSADGTVTATAVMPLVDLRSRPEHLREKDARTEMMVDAQKPFDLTKGPLISCRLFRLDEEEHILSINVHHITFDGWSHGLLVREFLTLYESLVAGTENPLPPMEIQYLDFAVWQREYLTGKTLQRQIDFWAKQIKGVPVLELYTDRPHPALRSHAGTGYPVTFTQDQSDKLRALSKQEGCTLFITVLAAFRTLLYRYTGQGDIAIGTLIANRTRPELEKIIGFFANTLALRTDVSDQPTFLDLLHREREASLDAYSHQDLPFEKLVEELNPERDLSRTPFIQVMLILQNMPKAEKEGAGSVRIAPLSVDSKTAKFDFTLYLTDGPELGGFLEYNTDIYEEDTVARLTRHLVSLVDEITLDPNRTLEAFPLMGEEEKTRMLRGWNDTVTPFESELCLHHLFEKQVAQQPNTPALIYNGKALTYMELNLRANHLAGLLTAMGVGGETFVGVCTDRSPVMMSALLAVLKVGAAYLPMDPDYPDDRLSFMLEDTKAPVLLTLKDLAEKLPKHTAKTVLLNNDAPGFSVPEGMDYTPSDENPNCAVHPLNLAYVIHTSGSTGKPKGVTISHRCVVNFLASMAKRPGIKPTDTLLAVTTLSFDIAGLELYLPLSSGAKLVVASRESTSAGEELMKLMKSSGATIMQATPATWRLLLDAGWKGDGSLKILCGGEALPRDLAETLLTKSSSLWNVYGPTEATIWATVHRVEAGDGANGTVTIGQPMDNYSVYLLDAKLNPVPIGVPGELHIGGDGLARGYLNRGDLTARQFIPNPFALADQGGTRLYKTGDLAAWSPEGKISFLGRIDTQVKVRGYRIELGEIETQLNQHPAIGQGVVIVREDKPGQKRLVAYLVPAKDKATGKPMANPPVPELKEFLKQSVPDYMVPALFIPLKEMPLTPNGKVNRKGLPKPDPALLRTEKFVAPRDETETQMAAIWSEVLDVKQIGINDDFFDLGGDSLMVIRVVAKAKKADLSITTKQVFQHKTVAELSAVVGTLIILSEPEPVVGSIGMSPAQTHFRGLNHTQPHLHSLGAFITPKDGHFDIPALKAAFAKILEQHDTLRIHMLLDENGQADLIGDPIPDELPLEMVDFSHITDPEEQTAAFKAHAGSFFSSYVLEEGTLCKAALYQYGDVQEPVLFLITHFFCADIVSWQILLEDFDNIYRQLSRGEELEIDDKTTSFRQWVTKLTERANSSDMDEEREYWLMKERHDTARMPYDFPDGDNLMKSSKSVWLEFDEEETNTFLKKIPRTTGAQIDAVVLTAALYAFEEWTGSRSLLIDLLGHGREPLFDDVDLTRTCGWLNTIFPAYLTLGDAKHPVAAMKNLNDQLRSIPNGGIGYGILRYLNKDPKIIEHFKSLPEPEIFFNFFGDDHSSELSVLTKKEGFFGYGYDHETHRLRPLAMGIYIKENRMRFRWEHSTYMHRHETIQKVAASAERVLKQILAEYDRD